MYLIPMFLAFGMVTGILARRSPHIPQLSDRLTKVVLWGLLFLLGAEMGSNGEVTSAVGSIGANAVVIAIAATGASVAAVSLLLVRHSKDQK